MRRIVWAAVVSVTMWQSICGDDFNPAYFEELAAQPLMVIYKMVTTERNSASVRSLVFDELVVREARKNNMSLLEMQAYINGNLHQEHQQRCNGENTFSLTNLGDGSQGPKNSQANFSRKSQKPIADYEYYIKHLGIRGPHEVRADRIFQQWGLRDKEWWLDRKGAFAAAGATLPPQGVELVNGIQCHVFSLNKDTFWVDQKDGRRIMRHRVEWEPGVSKIDVTYSDYRNYGKYTLPWQMECTFYCHASLEPALKGNVAYRTRLQVESLELGAARIPDTIFSEVPVPAGTLVFDVDTDQSMVLGNRRTGEVNTMMLDEMGFRLPAKQTPWVTIVLAVVGSLGLIAIVIRLIAGRRR